MTSGGDNPISVAERTRARGRAARRPHDAQASRQALLDAATALFDERGYEATTIRQIGQRAGVDAALIARYFGGKEGIYLATISQEGRPSLPGDLQEAFAAMLNRGETQGIGPVPLGMVNPNLTDEMRQQLRDLMGERAVGPIADALAERGVPDARLRAELLVAMTTGIVLTRASGTLPRLAGAPLRRVLEILEPAVEALRPPTP
jgi:AcrR family transcriptional regulator